MSDAPQPPEKKRKTTLREKFREAARKLRNFRWKDLPEIGLETLKDLSQPREIAFLVATLLLPGGTIVYPLYRVSQYYKKHPPANDNAKPPAPEPKEPPQPAPPGP